MATLIQCHRLTHFLGNKTLFRSLDIVINEGDKIGLVGHNGSGKSTLLDILSQALEADEGEISINRGLQLEVVEQFINPRLSDHTLAEALADNLPEEGKDFNQYRVEQLLAELGFSPDEYNYRISDLSGGQQNRLMFARAVINNPNLILFDEPTNHLDLITLLYFEKFLQQLDAGFLLISHDRQFLDAVTDRTVFLRDERIYSFKSPLYNGKNPYGCSGRSRQCQTPCHLGKGLRQRKIRCESQKHGEAGREDGREQDLCQQRFEAQSRSGAALSTR